MIFGKDRGNNTGPHGGLYAGPTGGSHTGPSDEPYRSKVPPIHIFVEQLEKRGNDRVAALLRKHHGL